jgi:6-phosphogluconolactonase
MLGCMAAVQFVEGASDSDIACWLEERLVSALMNTRGEVAICVPGGATPVPILARLAKAPLNWPRVVVWPGDDRIVPPDHPASNYGLIRHALGPAGARIIALTEGARPPYFCITWLGMGGDGHIASLFPNTDPSPTDPIPIRRLRPDPLPPEAPFERLSLTIPTLLDCDALLFVICGEEKRRLFEEAARGENDLPVARLLAAARHRITCFT